MSVQIALTIVLYCLLVCRLSGQTPAAGTNPRATVIHSTRREVLVDLVARDKHHHLVTDLHPQEVEIYEDGELQKINAFGNVAGSEQLATEKRVASISVASAAADRLQGPVTSLHEINFVTIVFADIAPLNTQFAREAIREFLKSDNLPNTYVSIYKLSHTLRLVQIYSDNKDVLLKAVDKATKGTRTDDAVGVDAAVASGAFSSFQALANNILSSPNIDLATANAVRDAELHPFAFIANDPNFVRNASAQDVSVTLGNAILTQARIQNGIRFASNLSNGMDAIDSLREIVRSQENLPGRKVVLYLSDGLQFPMNRRDAVDNLISYANRLEVAFYAVDTRGLSVEDPMMRSISELERTAAVSSSQKSDPLNGHKEDDDIQLTAVANQQLPLRELAESTGGFAVTDTNEIALPMQRVMEDIRSHYEIAYTPTSTTFDGHFRKIVVKIKRPHVSDLHYRKGYFALPDLNGKPLQPFEAVALNAINTHPASALFPYRTAILRFRPGENVVEHQLMFEIPLSALHSASDRRTHKPRVQISLLALFHNREGDIVAKISRELTRELQGMDAAQSASDYILYAEPVELAPGHYTADTAVTDEQSGQTSVARLAFYVSPAKEFGLSSLQLVRQQPGSLTPSGGIPAGSREILPTLSDSVASGTPVHLYFILYPSKLNATESPRVVLQLLHDGREIARKPLTLPKPDPDGSVPVMLRVSPDPGQCDVFVTAQQGALVAQSSLSFTVE